MSRARMPSQAGDKAAIRRLCLPSCHMWRLYCHILSRHLLTPGQIIDGTSIRPLHHVVAINNYEPASEALRPGRCGQHPQAYACLTFGKSLAA
jgi:hypothetical protein